MMLVKFMRPVSVITLVVTVFFAATASAQDFPLIYNSEVDKTAKPMSAAEAAAGFEVPEGFNVNVFASEPDVQNPVAMTWDTRGRIWVAENFTYAERNQRFDLSLMDRVLIFEDTDGDGIAEKRTVFSDQVQMLTSIEVGHGGVWLMCPSKLLFIPDANRDDVPDGPAITVLDGFTVAKVNYHNFANGLKWGPDGWLYGRCGGSCPGRIGVPGATADQRVALEGGIWRYHPRTKSFEVLSHGTTNPWGHDWNEFGDGFFINTVNGHLWHLIPGAHFKRPFTLDPNPHVYELIDMHADHWHFDTNSSWSKSRDGVANEFGGGHAHTGMMIYLGDNWPNQYRGRLMTVNYHGRRINQELLNRHGSGYVGKHGPDTLIAADSFFRGLELTYGPDGSAYVLDWSDTGECHERTGVHRTSGRIYRVRYGANSEKGANSKTDSDDSQQSRDLRSFSNTELVELMSHRNEWFVRQARIVLSERSQSDRPNTQSAVQQLKQMANQTNAVIAYRSAVTLHAMDAAGPEFLQTLMTHQDEHVRAWSIRLLADHWPIDDVFGPTALSKLHSKRVAAECDAILPKLCDVAKRDQSGLVRLTLASTLQRIPVDRRARLASALMSRAEDAGDHNLPLLVWYGLVPVSKSAPSDLTELAIQSTWPKTQRLIARRLAELIEIHPKELEKLLASAITADKRTRNNLLAGISDGLKGWSRAPEPANWPLVVDAVGNNPDGHAMVMIRDLGVLFGDGRSLNEVRKIVLDRDAEIGIRRSSLETLVGSNDPGVVDICLKLIGDTRVNTVALKGVAKSNHVKVAKKLIGNYGRFRSPSRPKVIEVLVSRTNFASTLLDAIENGKIPVSDLTAFDVRQIRSLGDPELLERVTALWGEIRESTAEKQERILSLKKQLDAERLASASLGHGRLLFNNSCAKCHRLFGQGQSIGPDLTGANRNNIDYLLDNIVDPSAEVGKDFGMTIVRTTDGQVFNGLVAAKTEKTITLQTQTELKTIALDDIEETKKTTMSPMPDGILDNLTQTQVRDLIAYLMQPSQVALPSE